jgi:hypothetical protein
MDLTDKGKELFGRDKIVSSAASVPRVTAYCMRVHIHLSMKAPDLTFLSLQQRIQQMHQDIVYEYPPNVTPLGSSPRCAVQGMYSPRRFITVQGHPEFTGDIITEIIQTRAKQGIFKEDQAQDALSRAHNEHDGVNIGVVFLKFLLED